MCCHPPGMQVAVVVKTTRNLQPCRIRVLRTTPCQETTQFCMTPILLFTERSPRIGRWIKSNPPVLGWMSLYGNPKLFSTDTYQFFHRFLSSFAILFVPGDSNADKSTIFCHPTTPRGTRTHTHIDQDAGAVCGSQVCFVMPGSRSSRCSLIG